MGMTIEGIITKKMQTEYLDQVMTLTEEINRKEDMTERIVESIKKKILEEIKMITMIEDEITTIIEMTIKEINTRTEIKAIKENTGLIKKITSETTIEKEPTDKRNR